MNPLARREYLLSHFEDGTGSALPPKGSFVGIDATFGVPGRPQSASNQTALLTGEPAPRLIGRHVLGFPNGALRELIDAHSVVKTLVANGQTAEFANAYPAGYLDALGLKRRPSEAPDVVIPPRAIRKLKPSATTCAFAAGNVALRTLDDARREEALTHDVLGTRARARGFGVPEHTFKSAAEIFWRVANGTDFTLFEHHLADEAGHAQDLEAAELALSSFDGFARAVIEQRPEDALVVICSDHGNVEDLSIRNHTLAKIPVLRFGPPAGLDTPLENLADLGRAILQWTGARA